MLDQFCAMLRGDRVEWPSAPAECRAMFDLASHHRVHLLLADRLAAGGAGDCPGELREMFASALRQGAVVERLRRIELRSVLSSLNDVRVRPVVFKGAALAHTHYARPVLRPFLDADLFVRQAE